MPSKDKVFSDLKSLLESFLFENDPFGFARHLYENTDCGPWVSFLMVGGRTVYYDDATPENVQNEQCVGIEIGSIVEGSDMEIGPYKLLFPFSEKELDDTLKSINDEASFYWDRDNSHWYVLENAQKTYYLKETLGEMSWDVKPPIKARRAAEAFLGSNEVSGAFPDYETKVPVPNVRGYTLREWCNDTTF